MSETKLYIMYLCLSLSSILIAAIIGIAISKKTRKADRIQKHITVTVFHMILIGFFVAAVLMFYPVYSTARFETDNNAMKIIKSLLMSILNTLQIFFLNGDFLGINTSVNAVIPGGLGNGYIIYSNILHVIAPILTFGFILTFFREAISMLDYVRRPFTDVYIISELNESSIELAKNIFDTPGKKQVVFTDVFEKNDEEIFELISKAKRLGAICLKKDITELWLKNARIKHKFFFISRNEDENLRQALTIVNRLKDSKYDKNTTQLYVFAISAESATLLDAADHGNMKVRRINERHNLIIDTLYNTSIFDSAVKDENGIKHVNAAIIGLGTYGTELLKAMCWLCQIPGYELKIHVFDYDNGEDKIRNIAPELYSRNRERVYGEPYYNIWFHNNIDVKTIEFGNQIAELKDLTAIFVTLGTDEQNIETAMTLRMIAARNNDDNAPPFPPIYTVVYSALKNEIVKRNGGIKGIPDIKNGKPVYNNDFGITFIGDIATRFSLPVIEQTALESEGEKCHMAWSESELNTVKSELESATCEAQKEELRNKLKSLEEQLSQNKLKYERYEYFRLSSIAQAVHKKYMEELAPQMFVNGTLTKDGELYEHNRWSAYMRGEGYMLPEGDPIPDRKNHIAKLHSLLKPFGKLDKIDTDKDRNVKST